MKGGGPFLGGLILIGGSAEEFCYKILICSLSVLVAGQLESQEERKRFINDLRDYVKDTTFKHSLVEKVANILVGSCFKDVFVHKPSVWYRVSSWCHCTTYVLPYSKGLLTCRRQGEGMQLRTKCWWLLKNKPSHTSVWAWAYRPTQGGKGLFLVTPYADLSSLTIW